MSDDYFKSVPPEVNNARAHYNDERFQQLNSLFAQQSGAVWNYLLTVNGGGAAGVLAFIGAKSELARSGWPYLVLILFLIGLALVGVAHAVLIHRLDALTSSWLKTVSKYWRNEMAWSEVMHIDNQLVERRQWLPWSLGWASFFCFIAAIVIAACSFRSAAMLG